MLLREFELNLKYFLADFKFHHSNGNKTINSEKMGKQIQMQT